jgi:hypothetical protein
MNTLPTPSRWFTLTLATFLAVLMAAPAVVAQDPAPSVASTAELEAKLVAELTEVTLKGRWAPLKDGQLGPEKEDAYHIVSAKKMDGAKWQISARFNYGGRDVELPIPAVVKWAGDTAVLLFDNVNFGSPRSYSARLMITDHTYSGSWSGGDHGGMLYGVLIHEAHP